MKNSKKDAAIKKLLAHFKTFGKLLRSIEEAKGKGQYDAMGLAHALIAKTGHPEIEGIFFEVKGLKDSVTDDSESYNFFRRWQFEVECRMHAIAWEDRTYGPTFQLRDQYGKITGHKDFFAIKKPDIPADLKEDTSIPHSSDASSAPGGLLTSEHLKLEVKPLKDAMIAIERNIADLPTTQRDALKSNFEQVLRNIEAFGQKIENAERNLGAKIASIPRPGPGSGTSDSGGGTCSGMTAVYFNEEMTKLLAAINALKSFSGASGGGVTPDKLNEILKKFSDDIIYALPKMDEYLTRAIHQNGTEKLIALKLDEHRVSLKEAFEEKIEWLKDNMPRSSGWGWGLVNMILSIGILITLILNSIVFGPRVKLNEIGNWASDISVYVDKIARQDSLQNELIMMLNANLQKIAEHADTSDSTHGPLVKDNREKERAAEEARKQANEEARKKAEEIRNKAEEDKKEKGKNKVSDTTAAGKGKVIGLNPFNGDTVREK